MLWRWRLLVVCRTQGSRSTTELVAGAFHVHLSIAKSIQKRICLRQEFGCFRALEAPHDLSATINQFLVL